jgi:hypothetical protein
MDGIVNKVAGSGLVTIDPAEFANGEGTAVIDLKPLLFMGQILREKDLRDHIRTHDWTQYAGKVVGVTCSADAAVPTWAFMLISIALQPHTSRVYFADEKMLAERLVAEKIAGTDWSVYKDARVVIKGCGDASVPVNAYVMLAAALRPYARSIMYGEPCSTVPLYKSKPGGGT